MVYLLVVGVPLVGLLGILRAGHGLRAPLSIGGEWSMAVDKEPACPSPPGSILWQLAFTVSQSGNDALITLSDGVGTALEGTINGEALTTRAFTATIRGTQGARTLDGKINFAGCAPVGFHATRQAAKKRGV
ncbi:MAG TPA: hypothetical protein VMR62_15370 [Bryobacteraceae bacterium]|nr:hypothetical protein [Bryobacteraceae bacterium]